MATAVQIQITVESKEAQAALDALAKKLKDAGVEGEIAFKKAGEGADKMGGHISTGLDAVRLVSQEFGLRLPRAIEAMLSRMPGVTSALGSMLGAFAGIAGTEVFVHLAEEAEKFYKQMFDVNAAMREFAATAGKAANEKLIDESSLETSVGLLREANAQVAMLEQKRKAVGADQPGGGFTQYLGRSYSGGYGGGGIVQPPTFTPSDDRDEAAAAAIAAKETLRINQQKREFAEEALKNSQEANEQTLHGTALAQQQLKDAQALNALKRQGTLDQENDLHDLTVAAQHLQVLDHVDSRDKDFVKIHNVDPNAGKEAERIANLKAQEEYSAKRINLSREENLAIMKSDDELAQARLTGVELFFRKRLDIAKEMNAQFANEGKPEQAPAAIAAAQQKFDDETYEKEMAHVRSLHQARMEASTAGLTGAPRIVGERDNKVDRINSDPALAGHPEEAAQQRLAANAEMYQKLHELEERYNAEELADIDTRTAAQLGAYQKIDADTQKLLTERQQKFDNVYSGSPDNDQKARDLLAADKAAITAEGQAKKNLLNEQNNATDLQYAQQAAQAESRVREDGLMGWVAQYKNAAAEIEAQQKEHLAKMQEQAQKDGASQPEIEARKQSIVRESDAQIDELNQQMQHKIAGTLQEAFTNPVDFIKSAMEKMFFEIIANWIMHLHAFQSLFGNTMGAMQPGGGGTGAGSIGGAAGSVLRGSTGAFGGAPAGTSGTASVAASSPASGGAGAIGSTINSVSGLAQSFGLGGGNSSTNVWASQDTNGPMTGDTPDLTPAQQTAMNGGSWLDNNAGGLVASAGGAYNAFSGTVDAFKTGNPLTGALADGAEGAAIGSIVPGVGTLVGGAVGAAIGAGAGIAGAVTGMGSNIGARDYYNKQIFPQLNGLMMHPNGDFQSLIAEANSTANGALVYMAAHFGGPASDWVNDNYMKKELAKVVTTISDTAQGGRQFTQMNAMQFHSGGTITGFGDYATSHNEGMIHAMMGETVMNPGASSEHAGVLAAMNGGASAADIAGKYLAGSAPMGAGSSSGGDMHFHVHTLDTKTLTGWLKTGGAQMITKAQNDYSSQYAGDGISG